MTETATIARSNPMPEQAQALAAAWLTSPTMRIYANGFGVMQSNTDFTLVMLSHGTPAAIVSMSFISAKSLMEDLQKAMKALEEHLGQPVPNMEQMAAKMTQKSEP